MILWEFHEGFGGGRSVVDITAKKNLMLDIGGPSHFMMLRNSATLGISRLPLGSFETK
jgi:hypothetical protein